MNTHQPIVLITGATSGIGRHAAIHLATCGFRVFAAGRKPEALAALREEAAGLSIETVQFDVTDRAAIALAKTEIDRLTQGYGVDVLINNAGYGVVGPIEEMTPADIQAQYETNVFGLLAVTQAFLPQMRERRSGRIINVSSVGGRMTVPLFGLYNSTKYAVESLSDALRIELSAFNVKVILIEPGVIRSSFADRSMREVAKYQRPDSPYSAVLARVEELKTLLERQAVGPMVISRAIERAIRSARPRARYMAPFRAMLLVKIVRALPTHWVDCAMARAAGLTRKRLAVGAG